MRLETPVFALLFGALIFTSLYISMGSLFVSNNITYDVTVYNSRNGTNIYDSFGSINKTQTYMEQNVEDFMNKTLAPSDQDALFPFFSLTFTIGRNIFSSVSILKDLLQSVSEIIGIPPIFVSAAFTAIILLVLLSVILIIVGRSY
jgi:hypothetical protein